MDNFAPAASSLLEMTQQNIPDDETLVTRTRHGDREAFGCLYDRYARLVRAIVFDAVQDDEGASDMVQETFLRAYQKLDQLKQPDSFGPWLTSIARSICLEKRRSLKRDRHQFVGDHEPESQEISGTLMSAETSEEIQFMLQEVSQLPEQERLAIHAFYLDDQNAEQAGKILNLSRSGVYALLQRAFRRLATRLKSHEITSQDN